MIQKNPPCLATPIKRIMALLGLIGASAVLIATSQFGAGLSPDSAGYIATAQNMASGNGAVTYDGSPLLAHPPLYPSVLAFIDSVLGVDPLSSAHFVNAILFGFIVYLSGLLFIQYFESSKILALLGTGCVLVSFPIFDASLMAWSEPPFICLVLLFFLFCGKYVAKSDSRSLLIMSFSVALICLTRYIGMVFIFTGISIIFLYRRNRPKTTLWHSLLFVSVSVLPIAVWAIRNHSISGTFFGPRGSSVLTLPQNLSLTLETILYWYIPRMISEPLSFQIILGLAMGFLAVLIIRGNRIKLRNIFSEMTPLLLLIIPYTALLIITSSIYAYDKIGNRLLSPVYVPVTLLLLFLGYRVFKQLAEKWLPRKSVNVLLVAVIALWMVYPALKTMVSIKGAIKHGIGYSNESWRNSQTIGYIRQNNTTLSDSLVYSNGPDVLYIWTHLTSREIPTRPLADMHREINDSPSLKNFWPRKSHSYLVWFNEIDRDYLFTVDELRTAAHIKQIIRLEDGAIYSVEKKR